jgi:hypothetical protein
VFKGFSSDFVCCFFLRLGAPCNDNAVPERYSLLQHAEEGNRRYPSLHVRGRTQGSRFHDLTRAVSGNPISPDNVGDTCSVVSALGARPDSAVPPAQAPRASMASFEAAGATDPQRRRRRTHVSSMNRDCTTETAQHGLRGRVSCSCPEGTGTTSNSVLTSTPVAKTLLEVAGIEPASSGFSTGLLRAQPTARSRTSSRRRPCPRSQSPLGFLGG